MVGGTIKTKQQWMEWFGDNPGEIVETAGDPIKTFNESYHMGLEGKIPIMLILLAAVSTGPIIVIYGFDEV